MLSFTWSWKSIVLKWNTFFMIGSCICFYEYFTLYMKQLGLTSSQIGTTAHFGISGLFAMVIGFLGDKFRARKLLLVITIVVLALLSLAPLLPLQITSLLICPVMVGNSSSNSETTTWNTSVALEEKSRIKRRKKEGNGLSALFAFMLILNMVYTLFTSSALTLNNLCIQAYNKSNEAKYGSYMLWSQIAAAVTLFAVGMIASAIHVTICGQTKYGYFLIFPVTAIMLILALIVVPWIDFKYLEYRVITWAEVKEVIFDIHYIVVLLVGFWCAWCFSFQLHWEFWYIDYLSGGPTVLAFAGAIRRPCVAALFAFSVHVIERFGDLQTLAFAQLLFAVPNMVLAFIGNPWLVLVLDIVESAALALSYSALVVHFSKAGTKASSTVMSGLAILSWELGRGIGSTVTGWLFFSFGPRQTLFSYGVISILVMVLFLCFIFSSKHINDYKLIEESEG